MFNNDRASPCHLNTNFMSDFKEFENPWSADNSEWLNEENDKWFDGGEYTEWLKEVPEDLTVQEKDEKTKGGYVYSFEGTSYGKLSNIGNSEEIYLVDENDVTITKTGKYAFKKVSIFKWRSGGKVLKKDFEFIVSTLYAESSGEYEETLGIYNVCENRAFQDKKNILEVITSSQPYGVYGSDYEDREKYFSDKGKDAVSKRKNVIKAFINGVNGNEDLSNGAYYWDGKDFNSGGGNRERYEPGYKFTDSSHDIWEKKDNLLVDADGNPTGVAKHGKYSYKYESVIVLGKTTFSKLSEQYGDLLFREADGSTIRKSNWNGSKPIN